MDVAAGVRNSDNTSAPESLSRSRHRATNARPASRPSPSMGYCARFTKDATSYAPRSSRKSSTLSLLNSCAHDLAGIKAPDGTQQGGDALRERGRLGPLLRAMTQAPAARHEHHRSRCDTCEESSVVSGTADHVQLRKAQRPGRAAQAVGWLADSIRYSERGARAALPARSARP